MVDVLRGVSEGEIAAFTIIVAGNLETSAFETVAHSQTISIKVGSKT